MQCKELEAVLEQDGRGPLPPGAREHLAGCSACQGLLADLTAIVASARTIPAEVAPPDRIWIAIRAQMQAEGIIQEQQSVSIEQHTSWWHNVSALFRPRALATVGVSIALVFAVYLQRHKTAVSVGNTGTPVAQTSLAQDTSASNPVSVTPSTGELKPSPSELAGVTLTTLERDVPNMQLAGNSAVDASLRQNLRTVNEFIAECQKRLKQNPQDELAREYLYTAYQQKAELLSAMMESGRSEH